MPGVTSVMPFSVTWKRLRSCATSTPISIPSLISQPRSITTRLSTTLFPTLTLGSTTESSTTLRDSIRTSVNNSERRTVAPLMTQPPDTIESSAVPRRSSSSNTNFAGGICSWWVQIGQVLSYRLSSGTTLVSSMLASQYASIVPTSRQYGAPPAVTPTQLSARLCANT